MRVYNAAPAVRKPAATETLLASSQLFRTGIGYFIRDMVSG
jgi:hypothetical protein